MEKFLYSEFLENTMLLLITKIVLLSSYHEDNLKENCCS